MKRLFVYITACMLISIQCVRGQSSCISCNGGNSIATGTGAVAAGVNSFAQGNNAVVIGYADSAFVNNAICIGNNLRDSGTGAILLGANNTAIGTNSFVAGIMGYAFGTNAYALGVNDSAIGTNSFSIGTFAKTSGTKSFAIGNNIFASGNNSIAVGTSLISSQTNSIVIGSGINPGQPLQNNVSNSLMVGFNSTTPTLYVGPAKNQGPASVGIGTITPQQMLDVNGNIAVSGTEVINSAGYWVGKPIGSRWYTGTTAPTTALGNDSDFYLNTVTDSVFEKQPVVGWKGIALIKGAKGIQGDSGRQGPPGVTMLDTGSVFLGKGATTSGTDAFAIGTNVTANGTNSFAIGSNVTNRNPYSFLVGFSPSSPLLFAGGGVAGAAAFVGIGTATPTAGIMLGVNGNAMIGAAGTPAAGAALTVNGNAAITGTATITGIVNANGGIDVGGTEVIDASGNAPGIVNDAVDQLKNTNAAGDVTGTYSALKVIQIQGSAVSGTKPSNKQVLQWDSIAKKWTPTTMPTSNYKSGAGISINGITISADSNIAIWNANQLQGYAIDNLAPAGGQVLQWDTVKNKWTPQTLKSAAPNTAWTVDSNNNSVFLYTAVHANVGIGTKQPVALLQVQGGHSFSTDSTFIVDSNGNVAIGTTNIDTPYKLSVRGEIRAMGITVESDWADYVFDPGYSLMPLPQVAQYISANGHLPGTFSAEQIAQQGLNVGKTQKMMMEKIEELTLYMIELQKQNRELTDKINSLQSKIK